MTSRSCHNSRDTHLVRHHASLSSLTDTLLPLSLAQKTSAKCTKSLRTSMNMKGRSHQFHLLKHNRFLGYIVTALLFLHRENNRYRHFKWTDLPQERRGQKVWFTVLSRLFSVRWSGLKHRAFVLSVWEDSPWASVCQWPYPCTSSYHTCPWWRSLQTGPSRASGSTRVRKPRTVVWLWRFPSPEHTGGSKAQQIMSHCSSKAKTQHPGCFSHCMWWSPHDKTVWNGVVRGKRTKQVADNRKTMTLGSMMLMFRQAELDTDENVSSSSTTCDTSFRYSCHKCLIQGFVF